MVDPGLQDKVNFFHIILSCFTGLIW